MYGNKTDARAAGEKYYFTGKPCKRGHLAKRLTATSNCVECFAITNKQWISENKERSISNKKAWRNNNQARVAALHSQWVKDNPDRMRQHYKNYRRTLQENFPEIVACRNLLRASLVRIGKKKEGRTSTVLGYSSTQLKIHIEAKFKSGMSWKNHGEWHIDHIKSIVKFIEEGISDPQVINALSNLQPLWAVENIKKGSK